MIIKGIDITPIFQALISILALLVTAYLVPWLRLKIGEQKTEHLLQIIQIAVQAAEQYFGSGSGAEKKAYVLDYLEAKGIDVDDATIEAMVNELYGKENAPGGAPSYDVKMTGIGEEDPE